MAQIVVTIKDIDELAALAVFLKEHRIAGVVGNHHEQQIDADNDITVTNMIIEAAEESPIPAELVNYVDLSHIAEQCEDGGYLDSRSGLQQLVIHARDLGVQETGADCLEDILASEVDG